MANKRTNFLHGYDAPEIDPNNMGISESQDNGSLDWDIERIEDRWIKNEELVGYFVFFKGYR
jgi:hypothetical protein